MGPENHLTSFPLLYLRTCGPEEAHMKSPSKARPVIGPGASEPGKSCQEAEVNLAYDGALLTDKKKSHLLAFPQRPRISQTR
jgi:hypothetical protein